MPALKDTGHIASLLGNTPLSQSPLWDAPLSRIDPFQIQAFIARVGFTGSRDIAETCIDRCLTELRRLRNAGEIDDVPMLRWRPASRRALTDRELEAGMEHLPATHRAAVVFALEMDLTPAQVGTLTWHQALMLKRHDLLTRPALEILAGNARRLGSKYVFWREENRRAAPLLDLDYRVFDAFGLLWSELAAAWREPAAAV